MAKLTRVEAEVFDTISLGFGIGKIEKGTRFHVERSKVPSGIWLLDSQSVRFAVRLMLIKEIQMEIANQYSDYHYRPESEALISSDM